MGAHTLTIESYDNNGGVFSTLYTDTVSILVTEFIRDAPVVPYMIITRGDFDSFNVEYIYSSGFYIPITANIRQPTDGTELNWVFF